MKKLILFLLLISPAAAFGQFSKPAVLSYYGNRAVQPAACSANVGSLYYDTTAKAFKFCSATNTWSALGGGAAVGSAIAGASANRVFYGGAGGTLAQSSSFFWDYTNNRLGLGTQTPRTALDILNAANPQIRFSYSDNSVYSEIQTTSAGYTQYTNTGGRTMFPSQAVSMTSLDVGTAYYDASVAFSVDSARSMLFNLYGSGNKRMTLSQSGNLGVNGDSLATTALRVNQRVADWVGIEIIGASVGTASLIEATPSGAGSPAFRVKSDGGVTTVSDVEITDSTKGIILRAPNATRYRVTVSNAGALVVTALP